MALDLRPLTLAELLDRAFGLYRRHLWLFIGIMAVPSAFGIAFSVLAESLNYVTGTPAVTPGSAPDPAEAVLAVAGLVAGMLIALCVYSVVYMVALGATTLAVSEIYMGRSVTIAGVYRRMRGSVWRLLRLLLLISLRAGGVALAGLVVAGAMGGMVSALGAPVWGGLLAVCGMFATFLIVGFMAVRWGVSAPAMVLEELGARAAIRRSIELTQGRRWRVLLLVICATIITYAVIALTQGPFMVGAAVVGALTPTGFALTLAGAILGAIGTAFTAPIMIIGLALLYYDARIRDEGLDLQLMMAAIDEPAGAAEASRG